eukprot:scaffold26954_cov44-Attheya_sp.AAC.1
MAQAALASFSRLLIPQKSNVERYKDDDSLSDVATKLQRSLRGFVQRSASNLNSMRQLHNSSHQLSASSFTTSSLPDLQEMSSEEDDDDGDYSAAEEYNDLDSVVDMAELALTGFMETLLEGFTKNLTLKELQLSHHSNHSDELESQTKQKEALLEARLKKSSIALFDLFAWSLRVNIDADVKVQRSQEFITKQQQKQHTKPVTKSPTSSLSRKKSKKKPPKKSMALEQQQQQLPAIHDDEEEDAHTTQSEEKDHPSLASHDQSRESKKDNDNDENSNDVHDDKWASNSTGLPSLAPLQDGKEEMGGSVQFRDGSVSHYDDESKRYDMDDSQKSDDPSGPSGEMSLFSHNDSDSGSESNYSAGHTTVSGDDNDDDNSDNYLRRSYSTAISTSLANISTTSSSSSYHTGSNGPSPYSTGSSGSTEVSSFAGIPHGTSESPSQMIDYSVSGSSNSHNSSEPSNSDSVSNHSESTASSKPFYYTREGKDTKKGGGRSVVTFTKNTVMGQKSTRSLFSRTQSISSMPSLETMNSGKRAEESSPGTDSDSRISDLQEEQGHDSSSTNGTRPAQSHTSIPSLGPMEASTNISKGSADSNQNSKEASVISLSLDDLKVYLDPIPQVAGAALQTGPRGVVMETLTGGIVAGASLQTGPRGVVTETLPGGIVVESLTPEWARDMQLHVSIRDHNFDESIQLTSHESADKMLPPVDPRNASLRRAISGFTKASDEYNPFAGEDKQEGTPAVLRNLPATKKDVNEDTAISEPTSAVDGSGTGSKSVGAQSSTALPSSFTGHSKFSSNDSQSNAIHSFGDTNEFPDNFGNLNAFDVQVLNRKGDGLHIMPMGDKEKKIFEGDASFDSASFKSQRRASSETGSLRSE